MVANERLRISSSSLAPAPTVDTSICIGAKEHGELRELSWNLLICEEISIALSFAYRQDIQVHGIKFFKVPYIYLGFPELL